MTAQEGKAKNKGGQPTKYKAEYAELVYKYCLMGADDSYLAILFDVTETTINNWKKAHKEFFESIKKGKGIADAEIAERLYNRAKGVTVKQQSAQKVKEISYNNEGKRVEKEEVVVVDLEQELPPDTAAAIFWLKNRQKAHWRDKHGVEPPITDDKEININIVRVSRKVTE